jgi:hypothetical protein
LFSLPLKWTVVQISPFPYLVHKIVLELLSKKNCTGAIRRPFEWNPRNSSLVNTTCFSCGIICVHTCFVDIAGSYGSGHLTSPEHLIFCALFSPWFHTAALFWCHLEFLCLAYFWMTFISTEYICQESDVSNHSTHDMFVLIN